MKKILVNSLIAFSIIALYATSSYAIGFNDLEDIKKSCEQKGTPPRHISTDYILSQDGMDNCMIDEVTTRVLRETSSLKLLEWIKQNPSSISSCIMPSGRNTDNILTLIASLDEDRVEVNKFILKLKSIDPKANGDTCVADDGTSHIITSINRQVFYLKKYQEWLSTAPTCFNENSDRYCYVTAFGATLCSGGKESDRLLTCQKSLDNEILYVRNRTNDLEEASLLISYVSTYTNATECTPEVGTPTHESRAYTSKSL